MNDPSSPFRTFRLNGLALRNRVIKSATFEGMAPEGNVSEGLIKHHRDLAAGGVGMTTVAYCAVTPDGRTFRDQLHMRPEVVADLRQLTDAVHREGAAASIQLGHCGSFCGNEELHRRRPGGPSWSFNALGAFRGLPFAEALSESEIEEITEAFARASLLAVEAGLDAVELHLGHGYLLSQFLSPATNRRRDAYGGSAEGRARFALQVVERVRQRLPPTFPVLAKMNLRDGFRGGLELDGAIQLARWLESRGVDALVLSGGFVSRDAFYLFRGERPLGEMIRVERNPAQKVALALFGRAVIRAYPFEPLYFLPLAREVRKAVRMPLVLLGGVKSMQDLRTAMTEGFELAGMARALIHDPALIAKYVAQTAETSACIPCNRCVAEMDSPGGVRCAHVPEQLAERAASLRSSA